MRSLRHMFLAAATAAAVLSGSAVAQDAKPVDPKYTWDLTRYYADAAAWDAARRDVQAELPKIAARKGTLGRDAEALADALDEMSATLKKLYRVYMYASLQADEDTRVAPAQERRGLASKLLDDYRAATSWVSPEVLAIGADKVNAFIAAEPRLAVHDQALRNILRNAPHTLTLEGESVIAAAAGVVSVPSDIYGQISYSDLVYPEIVLSTGEKVRIDQNGYVRHRAAANRADRKAAFDAYWGALKQYESTFGQILAGHVKGHIFEAKVRRFDNALQSALFGDNLPEPVYRTLVAEVNKGLPILWRYWALKKKMLGIEDELRYYDMYADVVRLDRAFTIEESQRLTLTAVRPLGEDYTRQLEAAFNSRWAHVYPQPGKTGGAYAWGSAYDVPPVLLLNHNDDYDSLTTFGHEWGHVMHSVLSNATQPFEKADYATFIAELAAITNEMLLQEQMIASAKTKEEKLFFLSQAVDTIRGTMFRQVQFAEFELAIHEAAEKGEALTGAKLSEIYAGLLRRYMGEAEGAMKIDDLYTMEWAFVSHFFERNFYVFQYATSMAGAGYFADRLLTGDVAERENFLNVLRAGGSDYPYEILMKAGLDMAKPEPYRAVLDRMERYVAEMEKLVAER